MTAEDQRPKTQDQKPIAWQTVKRVLIVKLRSIGDTVLATPSLIALRRFLPDAKIDILLEDWVAPLLEGHDAVNEVLSMPPGNAARLKMAREIRRRRYDVAFNLHGGTTATFFVAASRAAYRIGLRSYQYAFVYTHAFPSADNFWGTRKLHSAEQQLALLGFAGVPVKDRPKTHLVVTDKGRTARVSGWNDCSRYALMHPSTAFFTKQWPVENFARTAEYLAEQDLKIVAIASKAENEVLENLKQQSKVPIQTYNDLTLPEITTLTSKATLFVGNDSGIAHIAAAVQTPSVVIFGSSNRTHWRPWTDAPHEIVYEEFSCQPCPGYECKEFGEPRCILTVKPNAVSAAIDRLLDR